MKHDYANYSKGSGNIEQAEQIFEQLLESDMSDFDAMFEYLDLLREHKKWEKMRDMIQRLRLDIDEESGLNGWIRFSHNWAQFSGFHTVVTIIATSEDEYKLVRDGYETAIEAAKVKRKAALSQMQPNELVRVQNILAMLPYYYASWLYRTQKDEKTVQMAIDLLEQVLLLQDCDFHDINVANHTYSAKSLARKRLAVVYSEQARKSEVDSDASQYYIEKLRGMSSIESTSLTMEHTYALARYYAVVGKEKECKDVLRNTLKTNLELLSDDDQGNDYIGYAGLSNCMAFAGQDDDALAAVC